MSEISHVARLHGSLASIIGQRPSPWHPIEPSRDAHAWPDTMATDWLRLRAIVDGLLHRAAAARAAADTVAATNPTSQPQEVTHG
jgi:hypothetical protein